MFVTQNRGSQHDHHRSGMGRARDDATNYRLEDLRTSDGVHLGAAGALDRAAGRTREDGRRSIS